MSKIKKKYKSEDRLKVRYSQLSKIFFIIAFISIIWIGVVALGAFIWEKGPKWAGLTLINWTYAGLVLIVVFIILELLFFFHYAYVKKKRLEEKKPKPEHHHGKRVYSYTSPKGVEGGCFSKTYVDIDENSVLRLRTLIIPPGELWSKKEEKK